MSKPDRGQVFVAEINRISLGNGIITYSDGNVNIGPVTEDSIGKEVTALMISPMYAECLTESVLKSGYYEFRRMIYSNASHRSTLDPVSRTEINELRKRIKSDSTDEIEPPTPAEPDDDDKNGDQPAENSSEDNSEDNDELETLREEAVESAVKSVSNQATATSQSTEQYNRSAKIKEYVKSRADGNCEGCEHPSPFTSKTGEPYFHVHHVHELSDGGSDTPDTVIALCPNCHYRVHHGQDGDEFNQQLINKLSDIEEVSVEEIMSKS